MLKVEISLAWLILSCGQVLFWWRRDNIFGYLQAGFFFASVAVPVFCTDLLDGFDEEYVNRYADVLMIGAFAYLIGLACGAALGQKRPLPNSIFRTPMDPVPALFVRRVRQVTLAGLSILALSFVLLGYVPILAADTVAAKYGVGAYEAGFSRGSLVFHVGLIVAGTIVPVILALSVRHKQPIDMILTGAVLLALSASLSRGRAFIGPLVLIVAIAIHRRWRPATIVGVVFFAYIGGALFNEIVHIASPEQGTSFASRVASSAPDVDDQVSFIRGYELAGSKQVGLKPVLSSLSLDKGDYNPSRYTLRIRTGFSDLRGFASGGLRLPAPIWGYASFGFPGVVAWSLLSGTVIGWGASQVRRMLVTTKNAPALYLNLVLAWVFYEGTTVVLAEFYFFERVGLVSFALVLILCRSRRKARRPPMSNLRKQHHTVITSK